MSRALTLVTGLAAAAFFAGGYALRRDVRERNLEMLPADMVRSPAAETAASARRSQTASCSGGRPRAPCRPTPRSRRSGPAPRRPDAPATCS